MTPVPARSPTSILKSHYQLTAHTHFSASLCCGVFQVFEGIPHPFDRLKRLVVPGALRTVRLRPGRKYCRLGDLASQVGWKHNDLITKLEAKRKERSSTAYKLKKTLAGLRRQAETSVASKVSDIDSKLLALGHSLAPKPAVAAKPAAAKSAAGKKASGKAGGKAAAADDDE